MNRLAVTAPDKVRLCNRAPVSAHFENGEDVIGILVRFQVENERRKTEHAQGRGGEDGALEAVRRFLLPDFSRRPGCPREMIRDLVEKTLDADRRLESA